MRSVVNNKKRLDRTTGIKRLLIGKLPFSASFRLALFSNLRHQLKGVVLAFSGPAIRLVKNRQPVLQDALHLAG